MASYLERVILIAFILSIAIPISIGHTQNYENESNWEEDSESDSDDGYDPSTGSDGGDDSKMGRYLRVFCSDAKNSKQCWKIIKPEVNRFSGTDGRSIARAVFDLAIQKSDEIRNKLEQLHQDSADESLKAKYLSCSRNYNIARQSLAMAKASLDTDDFQRSEELKESKNELQSCKHQFGKSSYDPAHIGDSNREFGRYFDIVNTATERFVKERDTDKALNN